MPQPRARARSSSQPSKPQSSARAQTSSESLSPEEMASLAEFDLVETALDEFQPPPELASRRELKVAKSAARSASLQAARTSGSATAGPGAHYFASSAPLKPGQGKAVPIQVAGASIVLQGGAGTFSKSELDEGTQLLIETFALSPAFSAPGSPRWCDLGCGWGAVACVLASIQKDARLWACDINRRAAALARSNARSLHLENMAVWNGDGLDACPTGFFDAILCNPPVRAGNRVIDKLFEDALRCLKPRAELWIVLRTAQGAKSWQKKLDERFESCDTIQISHGYRILRAAKAAAQ